MTFSYDDDRIIAGVEKLRFFPGAAVRGEGTWLVTPDGTRVLDFSAAWTAAGLGYGHPAITAAVTEALAAAPGASILSGTYPQAVGLAADLLRLTPTVGTDRRVYLGHAGTDANDVAVRAARRAKGRPGLVAFELGYHGGAGGSQGFSGVQVAGGAEADPHTLFLPYPDAARPDADAVLTDVLARCEERLARGDVAAVIVEPLQSDGGLIVPPDGFLAGLRDLTTRHDAYLIVDEVKVGLGRTGLLHAFGHDAITPDFVTFGKVLGGGLPLSAAVGPAEALDEPAASALMTTTGNPACCAAGRAVLAIVAEGTPVRNAAERGRHLVDALAAYRASGRPGAAQIGDVRGRGLSVGVELVDPASGDAADDVCARAAYRAWERGLVTYPVRGNVLELTPSLLVTADEIDEGVRRLADALDDVAGGAVTAEQLAPFSGW